MDERNSPVQWPTHMHQRAHMPASLTLSLCTLTPAAGGDTAGQEDEGLYATAPIYGLPSRGDNNMSSPQSKGCRNLPHALLCAHR